MRIAFSFIMSILKRSAERERVEMPMPNNLGEREREVRCPCQTIWGNRQLWNRWQLFYFCEDNWWQLVGKSKNWNVRSVVMVQCDQAVRLWSTMRYQMGPAVPLLYLQYRHCPELKNLINIKHKSEKIKLLLKSKLLCIKDLYHVQRTRLFYTL